METLIVPLILYFLFAPIWALVVAWGARRRVRDLEREVETLRSLLGRDGAGAREQSAVAPPELAGTVPPSMAPPQIVPSGAARPAEVRPPEVTADLSEVRPADPEIAAPEPTPTAPPVTPGDAPRPDVVPLAGPPRRTARPSVLETASRLFVAFFSGPGALARVGAALLLVGVGLGLRLAAEAGWLGVQTRLIGVLGVSAALFTLGWRWRTRRRPVAVALMGTAFGLLYLTAFTAARPGGPLSASAALVLLVVLGLLLGGVATVVRSQPLAVLGLLGGFLAPLLTADTTAGVNAGVTLLTYVVALGAGAVALGARFGWWGLPLLSFVMTFGIGVLWGSLNPASVTPPATLPFVLLAFLTAALSPLALPAPADRWSAAARLALVFAAPLALLSVTGAVLAPESLTTRRVGLTVTAVLTALLYAALARSPRTPDLRGPHTALAIGSATLAVPFAFGAEVTPAVWALEGAALAWSAGRLRSRGLSLAALGASGLATLAALPVSGESVLTDVVRALTLSGAAIVGAWGVRVLSPRRSDVLSALGLAWWLFGGALLATGAADGARSWNVLLVYVAVGSPLLAWLASRLTLPVLRVAALLPVALGGLSLLARASEPFPLADLGWLGVAGVTAAQLTLLERRDLNFPARPHALFHALTLAFVTAALTWAAAGALGERFGATWALCAWGAGPIVAVLLTLRLARVVPWVARDPVAYARVALLPLLAFAGLWFVLALPAAPDARPLPTLPVLNPLDLTLTGVWLTLFATFAGAGHARLPLGSSMIWSPLSRAGAALTARLPRRVVVWTLGLAALALASFAALRGVVVAARLPWEGDVLLGSGAAQATLTLTWTVFGLLLVLWGARRASRGTWLAGAALVAVVVVKLFVVDLAGTAPLARVVSFLGVGALLLLFGVLAPAPPAERDERPAS